MRELLPNDRQFDTAISSFDLVMRGYTEAPCERTAEDIAHVVDFLIAGLYTDDDELFSRFITWTADVLAARESRRQRCFLPWT